MELTAEALTAAIATGETDRVNRAIDEIGEADADVKAALFDDCLAELRDVYERGDGYQRQSVIRFLAALYPRLALRTVGTEQGTPAVPGEYTLDDAASHRRRLREWYVEALVDDDGRVRQAAARATKDLAVTADVLDADEELETVQSELRARAESLGDDVPRDELEQSRRMVAARANRSGSLLPEGLTEALE